jgi:predicted TIM-barrel fold metal-dependent hydrolase
MPDEPFVDAHMHFWDKSVPTLQWAWLEPGYRFRKWTSSVEIDAPQYLTAEFLAESAGTGMAGAVHVHCADPIGDPAVETRWLESVAADTGWPHAIVGACDLEAPDAAASIREQAECSRFRGVRAYASPQRLDADASTDAMSALADVGGSLEVRRHHDEFEPIDELATRWPSVTILLSQGCLPLERSAEQREEWSRAMRRIAGRPNVVCKISTVVGASQPECSVELVQPWVLGCIDAFGPDRCVMGTNFPVDRPYSTLVQLVDVYRASIAGLDPSERTAVLAGTAQRVYGLDLDVQAVSGAPT